jgi:hypothetical protein
MSRVKKCVVALLALALVSGIAVAQEGGGTLASVTYWSIAPGTQAQFEAGLKAHNQLHAGQEDPVPLLTWEMLSGPRVGQFGRGSFGHVWSDFDVEPANAAADVADSQVHITPYIAGAEPMVWDHLPGISNPAAAPGAISRIIEFYLHPGHEQAFLGAIKRIHEILAEHDWAPYDWYALVDGGEVPTMAVVLPRDNYAGFAPPDPSLDEVLGEEAAEIFEIIGKATRKQVNSTAAFRPDLSYMPSGE